MDILALREHLKAQKVSQAIPQEEKKEDIKYPQECHGQISGQRKFTEYQDCDSSSEDEIVPQSEEWTYDSNTPSLKKIKSLCENLNEEQWDWRRNKKLGAKSRDNFSEYLREQIITLT